MTYRTAPLRDTSPLRVSFAATFDRAPYDADDDPMARALLTFVVEGGDDGPDEARVAADLFLVLDVSGSMDRPEKYPLLVRAVREFVDRVEPGDRFGVAVFSTAAEVVRRLGEPAGRDAAGALIARMNDSRLKFGGGTFLAPGLRAAAAALEAGGGEGRARRLYVLTDGELHDADACQRELVDYRARGLEVHVYGFGTDFNAAALKLLVSDQLGGSVKPICDERDVVETFAHIADVNRRIVGRDATLTLTFSPQIDCGDAFSFRPQERHLGRVEGRRFERALGAVERGRRYAYLFEARLPAGATGDETPLARATLSFSRGGSLVEESAELAAPRAPAGLAGGAADQRVERAYAVLDVLRNPGDNAAELAAARARLELARLEGRDPALIDAIEKKIAVLEGRAPASSLDDADQLYLDADEATNLVSLRGLDR